MPQQVEINYRIEQRETIEMYGAETEISTVDNRNFVSIPKFWETCRIEAQGLGVGDSIEVTLQDACYSFIIRGLVKSPDYVWSANDTIPDPSSYGYVLIYSAALQSFNFNEILVAAEKWAVPHLKIKLKSIVHMLWFWTTLCGFGTKQHILCHLIFIIKNMAFITNSTHLNSYMVK